MNKKINILITIVLLIISSVVIVGSIYYAEEYSRQEFDQVIYYLSSGIQNTSPDVIKTIINSNIKAVILIFLILCIPIINNSKSSIYLKIKTKQSERKIQIYPITAIINHRMLYSVSIFLIAIIIGIKGFKIDKYMKYSFQKTDIYENYYIDSSTVNITFPEKKRNLIIISIESMESTLCSKENGGGWNYSLIPELEKLAVENINFSNTNKVGGALSIYGTTFTSGGLVAHTAGIPLITPATKRNNSGEYAGSGAFLENVHTLGDILSEQGYNLEIMMGSVGTYGGREQYFKTNGNYKVFDVNYAIQEGKMTEEDKVWWGFEDDKLYEWAKEEIIELSELNNPFNIIIHTADTHFIDGYLSKYAENKYETQYENVFAYASKLANDFIEWVKIQDFYENTTIVIVGDHLGMQSGFYSSHIDKDYERTIYNVIINSVMDKRNTVNRQFSSMDMFPTILASIGVKIEGEKLGLGTNLFSEEKTLIEELGYKYFDEELRKKSEFYNDAILGEDYELIKEAEEARKKHNNQTTENIEVE